jgi:hypothetical protein
MEPKYEVDGSKQTLIASSEETADAIIVSIKVIQQTQCWTPSIAFSNFSSF